MILLAVAGAILVLVPMVAGFLSRPDRNLSWLAAAAVTVAAAVGCVPAVRVLAGGAIEECRLPWSVPFGEFHLALDPLSAWFLVPTLVLSAVAAIYGVGYLRPWQGRRSLGAVWFFYALLVLGMALVLLARNAVLFLFAWELMAVASFFLVTFEHEREEVREAGWVYLVATHLGTAVVLALFLVLARATGSMDFAVWAAQGVPARGLADVVLLLAVVGFGTKAGFMPFHVWLPEAHPAAPSHVSAVMSGVMIKTGIYGLLRTLTFVGAPPLWWGWLLIGVGLTSGVLGVLFALAQHDLKRLLAYHSVENIGIIALGIGAGLLGRATGSPVLEVLGFGGALLHVVNHAMFKGLLFLGAGGVLHAAGTLEIDRLGGLARRLPWTAALFLVGAAAITGLPPLNGFVSEFLIFLGAFQGGAGTGGTVAASLAAVIAGLALIGGLAAACFTKALGIVFLGEPRSEHGAEAHESPWSMRLPMLVLAAGCGGIGLAAPFVVAGLRTALGAVSGLPDAAIRGNLGAAAGPLGQVVVVMAVFLGAVVILAVARRALLAGRRVAAGETWGCGYARPAARMQYTASSYAGPITTLFRPVLGTREHLQAPEGILPARSSLATETPDLCHGNLYHPAFQRANWGLSRLRWLQQGQVQLYVLYIAAALVVLLVWKFR